ncbi:ankyrin-1-like [Chenopodium quinoa]|uniref:ankyrin-1-like n=1 Tax=Chenopodium quinoa TaxID=63459 RepID=UPI000B775115|nr:ankyrin-1-like [Chenopodium quinoa]
MASSFSPFDHKTKQRIISAAFAGDLQYLMKVVNEFDNGGGIGKALENVRDNTFGRNALLTAAARSNLDVCKFLVEQLNFNVNEQDVNGDTPLHISTLEEDYATSAYLLDHGANCNITMDKGFTPLHYAAKRGRTNLLCLLISKGAQVDVQSRVGTPLHAAAAHGMSDAVEFLLENKANPNLACLNVLPSLMSAIYAKSKLCARLLIEWGADPNVVSQGMTPLILAASEGQTEIIKCLLRLGANPDLPNFYDSTPILIAAKLGNHADVIALLLKTTPIPTIPDWSVRGIMEYINSDEAHKKQALINEKKFYEAKAKGAESVKRGQYLEAAGWYSEAIILRPTNAAMLSKQKSLLG